MLPHKTDQADRGISRDRCYLFCLLADRKYISDAEGATYRNEEAKQIRSLYLLIIRVPVDPQLQYTREGRFHLGDCPDFLFFEVPALAVLTSFHIRHRLSLHAHEYLRHHPVIVVKIAHSCKVLTGIEDMQEVILVKSARCLRLPARGALFVIS